ncbi:PQQ-dependent sugar dehydrogenase [Nonomuraea sp. 10N515B]|uniref:PQQ-dependent sugar dehydrogenase n=1 Tax=Nonomuraea sp. 10N515B TaxID=3457422 RepID=UPI003FCEB899
MTNRRSGDKDLVEGGEAMSPRPFRRAATGVSLIAALALTACSTFQEPITNAGNVQPGATRNGGQVATLGVPTEIVSGLKAPWGLTFLPDGSALVSQRITGDLVRVPAGGGTPQTVGAVPGVVASSEGGLLGIVASRDFATDRTVYAYVSGAQENAIVALRIADDFRSPPGAEPTRVPVTTASCASTCNPVERAHS